MKQASPLPPYLLRRYQGWRATEFVENSAWFKRLAEDGQRPRAMVVSCCDSRVQFSSMFGAESGDFFIHRNIANLVPPYQPGKDQHGTSAALEYAVRVLKVSHIVIFGHSNCGGIAGCIDMCSGRAPDLERDDSFIGRWLDMVRPACDDTADIADPAERQEAMEKRGILVSLENLMSFPWIAEAVTRGDLSLHGLWTGISDGTLEVFDAERDDFVQVGNRQA